MGFVRKAPSVGSFGEPLIVALNLTLIFCGPRSPTFVRIDARTACASLALLALVEGVLVEESALELAATACGAGHGEPGYQEHGESGTAEHGSPSGSTSRLET